MRKNVCKLLCVLSAILFLAVSVWLCLTAAAHFERISASGGIIGGAGLPTLQFLFQSVILKSPAFYIAVFSFLGCISSGAVLIFSKKA